MKNRLHIEVEPLSEQRWARIERSLMERAELERFHPRSQPVEAPAVRRSSTWGVRSLLAAAALLATLALVVFAGRWLPDRASADHPSRITTGLSASHLALPGLNLDVAPESAVVVGTETAEGMLLVLDHGSIVCEVAPRDEHAPLIVLAGATRVRVIGTRFSVTRLDERAQVKVFEGTVEVSAGGQSSRVGAGEQWPTPLAQDVTQDPEAESGEDEPGQSAKPTTISQPEPRREPPSLAQAARERLGPIQESPKSDGDTTKDRPRASPAPQPRSSPTDTVAEGSAAVPEGAATSDETVEPRRSPQAIFEEATGLERSDPTRASELYQKLESQGGSWARNALYARARLAASRGNVGEARRLLERYLERYPRGSNAEDARAVLRKLR